MAFVYKPPSLSCFMTSGWTDGDIAPCEFFSSNQCEVSCLYLHFFPEIIFDPLTCTDFSLPDLWAYIMRTTHWPHFLVLLINFSLASLLFSELYCKTEGKIVSLPSSLSFILLSFSLTFFFLWDPSGFLGQDFVQNRGSVITVEWSSNGLPYRFILFIIISLRELIFFFPFFCVLSISFLKDV